MDSITISLATESEKEWAATLMSTSQPWLKLAVGLELCRNACRHPSYTLHIARSKTEPLGFILCIANGVAGSPYIKSICVAESARGAGVGAKLVQFTEEMFRKDSKHLFLCVSSFNDIAKSFYRNLGYNQVGQFDDYIIEGESEMLMYKSLM